MTKMFGAILLTLSLSQQASTFELTQGLTPPSLQKAILNYTGLIHDRSEFPKEQANMSYQTLDFSTPVYKKEDRSLSISFSGTEMKIDPAQSGYSRFYDLKGGVSYTHVVGEKRMWSLMMNYGSASDKPFQDPTVSTLGITAFYTYPSDTASSWLLLANYSNNRPILNNIPLPGFAWFYNPSKEFRLVLGAPFASVNWQFSENWGVNMFTLVPWVAKGSLYFKITPLAQVYGGVDFSQVTYLPYGRKDISDRLFYDEKKVFLGVRAPLSKTLFTDLEMGHAFDRRFFIAENYEMNPDNQVDIGNAYYAKLGFKFILF